MEMLEKDWSTEKKVVFVIEIFKEITERIDMILSIITNAFSVDDISQAAKKRMDLNTVNTEQEIQ